jgi:hypothetical protein
MLGSGECLMVDGITIVGVHVKERDRSQMDREKARE